MIEFRSMPQGSHMFYLHASGGTIRTAGPKSPVASMYCNIIMGDPQSFYCDRHTWECGHIITTPSGLLENENNCEHFAIDGSISNYEIDEYTKTGTISSSPENGNLWNRHQFVAGGYTQSCNAFALWGDTGSIVLKYPPGAYADRIGYHTGYKYMAWTGDEMSMTFVYGEYYYTSINKKQYDNCTITRWDLDTTRTKFKIRIFNGADYLSTYNLDNIHKVIWELDHQVRNWTTVIPSWNVFTNQGLFPVTYTRGSLVESKTREILTDLSPQDLFPGRSLDCSPFETQCDWGALAMQCCQQLTSLSVNGAAYTKDLLTLRESVVQLLKLAVDIDNPKAWASLYLSLHYGLKLTINDTKKIVEEVCQSYDHIGPAKSQSSVVKEDQSAHITSEYHLALYTDRYSSAFAKLYNWLLRYDSVPWDTQNLWDFIPFSFVLDWFIGVGDLLDQFDASNHIQAFIIRACETSIKHRRSLPNMNLGNTTTLSARWYNRQFSLDVPPLSYSLDLPLTNGFDHFVESGALVLQRLYR